MAENAFRRVNWTTGMLLTPDHFKRTDGFSVELFEWLLRYTTATTGLLGGGPRLARAERGLEHFDPRIDVSDNGTVVSVVIKQARGVTGDGGFVEVAPPRELRREFPKAELERQNELVIYVVRANDVTPDETSLGKDPANVACIAWAEEGYGIEHSVRADKLGVALAVGRVRRVSETQTFELDNQFIPACASMMAHSSLFAGWRRLREEVRTLASGFGELHRMIAKHVELMSQRGKPTRDDQTVSAFAERAVLALDACAYATIDPSMSPATVFQQVDRAGRQIALALDLSVATQEYLSELSGTDTSYSGLLQEERQALTADRDLVLRGDLRLELRRAEEVLLRIRALLRALEGKYLDYRINRSLDSLRFLIDRDGEAFYSFVPPVGQKQREGDVLTFTFSQLNLAAQRGYRLVLLGDPDGISSWNVDEELRVDLRINAGAGGGRPTSRVVKCEMPGQRNFAVTLPPVSDVATISTIHATVQPAHKVRGALLYLLQRGHGEARSTEPLPPSGPSRGGGDPTPTGRGPVVKPVTGESRRIIIDRKDKPPPR